MNSTSASSPVNVSPTALPPTGPSTEFERFLAALPDGMRDECRTKLSGSGLSPDLPVFTVLADALNRLLTAGISLKVERASDDSAYFLVLQGAHKAAPPVNSPEGLAVEVWP